MVKKNIKTSTKEYFFLHPTLKLRVRHIERAVNVPLPSVIRYTKELENEDILKISKVAGVTLYSADRASELFLLEKKLFNLKQLFLSGFVNFLREKFSNPLIIVFGSYSRGEDVEESDIDLYIETQTQKKYPLSNLRKYYKEEYNFLCMIIFRI